MLKLVIDKFEKVIDKDLSLKIPSIVFDGGKINVVQGANGTGKTTFLLVLLRADLKYKGLIKYIKDDCEYNPKNKDIIYVPPKNALVKYLSIKSNLNIFNGIDINSFINEFKINIKTNVANLSGGEEEIIAIYRLKDVSNKILLLDEVTSFLDDFMFDKVMKIILKLSKNNLVIFATHDVRVLNHYKPDLIF